VACSGGVVLYATAYGAANGTADGGTDGTADGGAYACCVLKLHLACFISNFKFNMCFDDIF